MLIMQVNGAHASVFGRQFGNLRQLEVCARGETNLPGWSNFHLVPRTSADPSLAVFDFIGTPRPPRPPGMGGVNVTEKVFAGIEMLVPITITRIAIVAETNQLTLPVEIGSKFEIEGDGYDIAGTIPSPWPHLPTPTKPVPRDGMGLMTPPANYSESFGKGNYAAVRMGNEILIRANGTLGSLNQVADLRIHTRAWPPRLALWVYSPEVMLPATRDFDFGQSFFFPPDVDCVTIYDADGTHEVPVLTPLWDEPAPARGNKRVDAEIQTGQGHTLEAAVENAISGFPDVSGADLLLRYDVVGSGKFIGGFVGLNLWFARVSRNQGQ